jgi:Arc/MetJ family transcription regulator
MAEKKNARKDVREALQEALNDPSLKLSSKLRSVMALALRVGDLAQMRALVERHIPDYLQGEETRQEAAAKAEETKTTSPEDEPEAMRKLAAKGVRGVPGKRRTPIRTRPAREVGGEGGAPTPKAKAPEPTPAKEEPKADEVPLGGEVKKKEPIKTRPVREVPPRKEGGLSPSDMPLPEAAKPKAETAPASPAKKPSVRDSAKFRERVARIRSAKSGKTMGTLGRLALGGLTGFTLAKILQGTPPDMSRLREEEDSARQRSASARIAELLEQARMERALAQNQARLAQANPTLYTSVMAGRKVPSGAVVLGGRPRTDLMRELAASMDSGAFQKRDPLSDLMG